jgi:hypothetical protein
MIERIPPPVPPMRRFRPCRGCNRFVTADEPVPALASLITPDRTFLPRPVRLGRPFRSWLGGAFRSWFPAVFVNTPLTEFREAFVELSPTFFRSLRPLNRPLAYSVTHGNTGINRLPPLRFRKSLRRWTVPQGSAGSGVDQPLPIECGRLAVRSQGGSLGSRRTAVLFGTGWQSAAVLPEGASPWLRPYSPLRHGPLRTRTVLGSRLPLSGTGFFTLWDLRPPPVTPGRLRSRPLTLRTLRTVSVPLLCCCFLALRRRFFAWW